jgi:glyoxylase-like metal-dependent hydrolase (beta-lactamase superfamily II)
MMSIGTLYRALTVAAVAFGTLSGAACAADAALERASTAMGAGGLKSIRYAGDGVGCTFGQAYKPGLAWPKIRIQSFARAINYDTGSMKEEILFSRAEGLGGGGYPHVAAQRNEQYLSGAYAWNQAGATPLPGPRYVADRVHQLWITPQGVVKAAIRNNATVGQTTRNGQTYSTATFQEPGRFKAVAFINAGGLVERVESRAPDPVLGEVDVITTYADYRDFGGVKFPTRIAQTQGGFPVLDLTVKDVQPNAPADIELPDAVKNATERVTTEKVAEGVWFIAGGSHNSVAIEMKDYMIVVETPLNDGRSVPVLEQVKQLVPGKPIRYVINSHTHFDHSGGLRAAVAEGATIITQAQNKPYFERAFAVQNTISPDALAKSGKTAKFKVVNEKMVLTDGTRTVELHHVADSNHTDTFLMTYLPRERLLIEADSFTPGPPNAPPPASLNPLNTNLVANLQRLDFPVDRILPLHGRVVPATELYAAVGQPAPAR